MARKLIGKSEEESGDTSVTEEFAEESPLPPVAVAKGNAVVGSAVKAAPVAAAEAVKVRSFRVTNGGFITDKQSGTRTRLTPGKEINDLNYDIVSLKKQGILLEEITGKSGY